MINKKLKLLIRNILYKKGCIITRSMYYSDKKLNIGNYGDYNRISSLELISNEIYERNISGNVAELGVYKGEFSSMINRCFPDRKLYLFDTFEGFDFKDISIEKNNNFSSGEQDFSNTSIMLVLKKMKYKENIIITKGRFPESLAQLKDYNKLIFSFVSIDVDLYQPTIEGLKFFYSKLQMGGYILVHDYNNKNYSGVKKAVREFCESNKVNYFPLNDTCGSVVIMK